MTTEMGFSPDDNGRKAWHSLKFMIHAVWGTKNREPYLVKDIRSLIVSHIKENARSKGIFIDTLDGYTEHLHCLIGLNADLSISKAMHLIKGESAFWINKQKVIRDKFEWADEYFAVSVSESVLDKVRTYINTQDGHHQKVSFAQECDKFIKKYNLDNRCNK